MPHYGILREYKLEEVDDVRGADVYGVNDEKLGTIDDVIFDHSSGEIRYVVLKTGGVLSSKRIMVPANRIEPYGNHDDRFYAELDKERLEMLPEFNDEMLKSEGGWADYEKNYEEQWKSGEVMYNKNTGRIITPPAKEQLQSGGGQQAGRGREDVVHDVTPQRLGKQDDYLGVASGTGKITLEPQKPSIAGRESVRGEGGERAQQATREVEGTMGTEFQVSEAHQHANSPTEAIREPGVYRLEPISETGQSTVDQSDVKQPGVPYGRRWLQFQQGLRERRDKVVSGCKLCGTQDKAA